MKTFKLLNTKLCELYFGLFAPCIMFYKNGYNNTNRLEISLILFKIYLSLNSTERDDYDVSMYGFYFKSNPSTFIYIWNGHSKSFLMPWVNVLVKRQLLTVNDIIFLRDNECLSLAEIKDLMQDKEIAELCTRYYQCGENKYKYYVTYIVKRPVIFKNIKWFNIFDNELFEIYVTLDEPLPTHNFTHFKMSTKHNIVLQYQINIELASMLSKSF